MIGHGVRAVYLQVTHRLQQVTHRLQQVSHRLGQVTDQKRKIDSLWITRYGLYYIIYYMYKYLDSVYMLNRQ